MRTVTINLKPTAYWQYALPPAIVQILSDRPNFESHAQKYTVTGLAGIPASGKAVYWLRFRSNKQ